MELIFNEIDSLSLNFNMNAYISIKLKSLFENGLTDYGSMDMLNFFKHIIDAPVNSKAYLQSIYVYIDNKQGVFLASESGISKLETNEDKSWYDSYIHYRDSSSVNTWIELRHVNLYSFNSAPANLLTVYKKTYTSGSKVADGVIVMNLKGDYIDHMLNGLTSYRDQAVFTLDENDTILSSSTGASRLDNGILQQIGDQTADFSELKLKNEPYMISQIRSDRYSLRYISIVPKKTIYKVPENLLLITVLLLLVSLILGFVLSYYFTKRNYNNLKVIISTIKSAEKGAELPALPSRVKDEYGYILQNIIKTFIEQSYLKVQLSEKKYRLKTMEMLALQSQINPHFLFNTLKTIFWKSISLTGEQNEVSKMIDSLTHILHYSLGNPDTTITLSEEISNTMSYIEIQKSRYKDMFRVVWQYDDKITNYKFMKLLFQPLVENSIYHGIKEKDGTSVIKIKITEDDSHLKICIFDNGLGMDGDTLREIRKRLNEDSEYSSHIGLINTNKRLKLAYGEKYGLRIRSKHGRATGVYIRIPIR
ncbi:sensor histidine kinase [Cohnella cellulosilytica]